MLELGLLIGGERRGFDKGVGGERDEERLLMWASLALLLIIVIDVIVFKSHRLVPLVMLLIHISWLLPFLHRRGMNREARTVLRMLGWTPERKLEAILSKVLLSTAIITFLSWWHRHLLLLINRYILLFGRSHGNTVILIATQCIVYYLLLLHFPNHVVNSEIILELFIE